LLQVTSQLVEELGHLVGTVAGMGGHQIVFKEAVFEFLDSWRRLVIDVL